MRRTRPTLSLLAMAACLLAQHRTAAQTLEQAYIDAGYTIESLGTITDLPSPYGGLTIKPSDINTLYIGGAANSVAGAVYSVPLLRESGTGRITGFGGAATMHRPAPYIDGGLHFAPNGTMLYTRYPENRLGQTLPNGDSLSIPLSPYMDGCGVGSLMLVPPGVPGAGNLIMVCYLGSSAFLLPYSIDGQGYFAPAVSSVSASSWPCSGPEGMAYVPPGSAGFTSPSVLLCSFSQGRVYVFAVNDQGLLIENSGQLMINGLSGAEGAVIDPVTGDFLFSTFLPGGGNQVYRVSGFAQPNTLHETANTLDRISLAPNPTSGLVMLRCDEAPPGAWIDLRDAQGKLIDQRALRSETMELDLSAAGAGIYAISIRSAGFAVTRHVLKQ